MVEDKVKVVTIKSNMDKEGNEKISSKQILQIPEGFGPKIKWVIDLPIKFLFYYVIPEVNEESEPGRFYCTFMLCLLFILIFSFVEVWLTLEISRLLDKDPIVLGILILAFGSGIPDLLDLFDNLKEGESYSAVLQSTGSNVFV